MHVCMCVDVYMLVCTYAYVHMYMHACSLFIEGMVTHELFVLWYGVLTQTVWW